MPPPAILFMFLCCSTVTVPPGLGHGHTSCRVVGLQILVPMTLPGWMRPFQLHSKQKPCIGAEQNQTRSVHRALHAWITWATGFCHCPASPVWVYSGTVI